MTEQAEREKEFKHLVEEVGLDPHEAKLRIERDADLWMVEPDRRFVWEGEEAVEEWEVAVGFLSGLSDMASNAPLFGNEAAMMCIWDAMMRAEEALRRARQRDSSLERRRAGTTRFEEVLHGFMEERGLKDAEELAVAMRDEMGQPYSGDEVRKNLENPADAKAEFFYMLGVGLDLDKEQELTMMRALNEDLNKRARLRRAAEPT